MVHIFKKKKKNGAWNSDYVALSFDESLNKIAQKLQMDLVARYCNNEGKLVCKYVTSSFLTDVTALGLLNGIKSSLSDLHINIKKII